MATSNEPATVPDLTGAPAHVLAPPPPLGGATDADLGGVDVTHEYVDADGNLRLSVGDTAPELWATVYAYGHAVLGLRPPGWIRENVNSYTIKYYGDRTKAAWCLIWVWCILSHFGKVAWKLAYVPWLNRIPGFKSGRSGIKAGDICAIARYSHVGFYVASHGAYFDLMSGNSTSGSSTDAITIKRYPVTIISGHVAMIWEATPTPTPTPAPAGEDHSGFVVGCN